VVDRRHRRAAGAHPSLYFARGGASAAGRALAVRNADCERDPIYSPPRPRQYDPVNGPIIRLFPDIRAIERDCFRRTGCFPPQHLIILRRDVWEQNKWIARSLTDAFIRCNDQFAATQRNFPYVSPWLDAELEETEAVMGKDFHPYGFEENRKVIDVFCRQAYELGIVGRLIAAEEYFAEYLAS
jgi:4,5-dihydroxyphthalate decarboxylase